MDCFGAEYDVSELLGRCGVSCVRYLIPETYNNDDFVYAYMHSGRFGDVHKVTHKESGAVFAGKLCTCSRPSQRKELELEVELMSELQFDKLARLHEAFIGKKEAVLVMEL